MSSLNLHPLPRISVNDVEQFRNDFQRKELPVVITDLSHQWPAYQKWTPAYFKELGKKITVDLYDNTKGDPAKSTMQPDARMPFTEYLELIEKGPVQLRMFLFNIMKHIPELCHDYDMPHLPGRFIKDIPMMFFGGAGSVVHMHYDIDLNNVYHTQFMGRKRVVLFAPDQSPLLYHLPFTVQSYANVNNPDYANMPALHYAQGYECILEHGETLYMPGGYWHYVEYLESGFGLSLRSFNRSLLKVVQGAWNIGVGFHFDNLMKKLLTNQWLHYKESLALSRASAAMEKHQLSHHPLLG